MYKRPEIRKYVRTEKPYIVTYRAKLSDDVDSKCWEKVAVVNLSAGGIFFQASNPDLKVDTLVNLKIGLYQTSLSIVCFGRVIRTKRHLTTSAIGFAIRFTEIDNQIKEVIDSIIQKPSNCC